MHKVFAISLYIMRIDKLNFLWYNIYVIKRDYKQKEKRNKKMNGTWTVNKYWWHPYGGVKKTTFIDSVMPIGWIRITEEMYNEYLSA